MLEAISIINIIYLFIMLVLVNSFADYLIYKYENIIKNIILIFVAVLVLLTILRPFIFQNKEVDRKEIVNYNKVYLNPVNDFPFDLGHYAIKVEEINYKPIKPFKGFIYWFNNPIYRKRNLIGIFKTDGMELLDK